MRKAKNNEFSNLITRIDWRQTLTASFLLYLSFMYMAFHCLNQWEIISHRKCGSCFIRYVEHQSISCVFSSIAFPMLFLVPLFKHVLSCACVQARSKNWHATRRLLLNLYKLVHSLLFRLFFTKCLAKISQAFYIEKERF